MSINAPCSSGRPITVKVQNSMNSYTKNWRKAINANNFKTKAGYTNKKLDDWMPHIWIYIEPNFHLRNTLLKRNEIESFLKPHWWYCWWKMDHIRKIIGIRNRNRWFNQNEAPKTVYNKAWIHTIYKKGNAAACLVLELEGNRTLWTTIAPGQ